jgi:hypothetical membrane protein
MSFYHEREERYAAKVSALHCNGVLLFKYHCLESCPVTSGAIQKIVTASKLRKVLLICGILSVLVYVVTDIIAGALYPGYSFTSQAVSELFAIGAPTSGLVVPLFTLSSVLLVAFAFGVWMSAAAAAGRNRALCVMALMLIGNAINGLVLWNFFPMHMRGAETTFTDTMHVTLAGTGVVFVLLALGFAIVAFRKWFRFYSIATVVMLLVPGIVVFLYVPEVGGNQPTPWLGLEERISFYVYDLWQVALVIVLLRGEIDRKAMVKASSSQHTAP